MDRSFGPWAAVTGASSGIGREFARQLASGGLDVVLVARSTTQLEELGAELTRDHGVDHRVVTLDVTLPDAATTLDRATTDLDVGMLVSNAGGARPAGPFLDQPLAELHRHVALNATSHLDLAHHFGRRMVARGGGRLVLVAANPGRHGLPWEANDSAAKGYVVHLADALRFELAAAGVGVTVMVPASVETPIVDQIGIDRSSMPARPMAVDVAVRRTLRAVERGRASVVPNRIAAVAGRLVPRSASIRLNARMLSSAIAPTEGADEPAE